MSEFPTTRTALEEIREGCYDIVQLSKKVDEAVNGSKRSNAGLTEGNGTRTSSRKSRKRFSDLESIIPYTADYD